MLGVVILTAAVMLLGKLPKVTAVSAEDGTYYTAAAVLAHAGIEAGDEMLGFDGFAKARELKKSLPLMDKVKIRKHLNGAVTISFTEVESLYYTCHNQNYYIINAETHEVLNVAGDAAEARRVGAIYLGLPECTRVRVGEELTFINLPYAPETDAPEISTFELETYEPERENAYVFEFVEILMKSSVAERVVGMELGDRYDLWLVLRGGIRIRVGTMDELYASIGYGGTTAMKAVARVKDELLRLDRLAAEKAAAANKTTAESVLVPGVSNTVFPDASLAKQPRKTDSGIVVAGLGNCTVKFAKCCTPVPGDPVIGFITRGYGVSVHRADCPNALESKRKPDELDRWVQCSWVESNLPNYRTALEVSSKDRDGLTVDVAMALSACKVKVVALSARAMPDGYAVMNMTLEVKNKEELATVINKLHNIQGVYQVTRTGGK
jgi:predicted amino acid-binding ACT domain protein